MKTHNSTTMDNAMGLIVGREALDKGFNRRILPPINSCPQVKPIPGRIKSQRQGLKVRRCYKCEEVGNYRNMCKSPRADFSID